MASKITRLRIAGASGALIGAGALAVALAAPASAAVTAVSIDTPSGYSSSQGNYGTGCSYTVSATYTGDGPVEFSAKNGSGPSARIGIVTPDPESTTKKVSVTWKPTAKGVYTIFASQGGNDAPTPVKANVSGPGIQLPNLPFLTTAATNGTCLVL